MMTSRMALIGLISLMPATALAADDDNWYFSLRGGLSSAEKSALDNSVNGLRGHSDHKNGFAFSGAVGYDLGGARIEGEVLRIQNKVDRYGFENDGGLGLPGGFTDAESGKTGVTAGMMNLYYDVDTGSSLTPYVGGGVGWGRTGYNDYRIGAANIVDDADKGLAYQLIAGLRAAVSDAIDVTADYRYFGTDEPNFTDALGRNIDSDFNTHLFMVGLVWKFGGKEEEVASTPEPVRAAAVQQPVEPEPAPAAEPFEDIEPAAGPEPVGPFTVYFEWDSAELTADAREEIERAAAAAKEREPVELLLKGHADTTGGDEYNIKLSQRRAQAVKDALIAAGVPSDSINTWGYGEGDLAVWTDNNVRERMNRRVQIIFEDQ